MTLLNMSLTGGVFILVVLLVRAAFQNIVPRRTFLVLWLAANALLLIPFRPRLPFSFYALVKRPEAAAAVQAAGTAAAVPSGGLPWWRIVWIAGGALLLIVMLGSNDALFQPLLDSPLCQDLDSKAWENCCQIVCEYADSIPKWCLFGLSAAQTGLCKAVHQSWETPEIYPQGFAIPHVAPDEPCPCGSGLRYCRCHGKYLS